MKREPTVVESRKPQARQRQSETKGQTKQLVKPISQSSATPFCTYKENQKLNKQ